MLWIDFTKYFQVFRETRLQCNFLTAIACHLLVIRQNYHEFQWNFVKTAFSTLYIMVNGMHWFHGIFCRTVEILMVSSLEKWPNKKLETNYSQKIKLSYEINRFHEKKLHYFSKPVYCAQCGTVEITDIYSHASLTEISWN